MFPPAPGSTLFPYTTLFRSQVVRAVEANEVDRAATVGEPAAQHAFQHLTAGERPHLVGVLDPAVRTGEGQEDRAHDLIVVPGNDTPVTPANDASASFTRIAYAL